MNNSFKKAASFVLILLLAISCQVSHKSEKSINSREDFDIVSFNIGNKRLDKNYIESGCFVTNSLENQIADIFSYTDFFHTYLQFKSYQSNFLNHFPCAQKLDQYTSSLYALDREPSDNLDFRSNIENYAIHREIIRNLHKIIDANKSPDGAYNLIAGIKSGKLFNSSQKDQINQLTNSKTNLKFHSYFDEKTGNYHEFFIPIKNFNLIKSYLLALNKNSKENVKGGGNNFLIAYSAMIHLTSPEIALNKTSVIGSKQFPWIDEISSTPYYSVIHPLNRFLALDNTINNPILAMSYSYPARMFKSHLLLTRALIETKILPKNFSIIPTIEKSLKSGNRQYCGTISSSSPESLLIVQQLHGNQFKVSKTYLKYCFNKLQNKLPNNKNQNLAKKIKT